MVVTDEGLLRFSERSESERKLGSECHFGKMMERFGEARKAFMTPKMEITGHVVRTL